MSDGVCDVTIIGGGVVGMATAMALTCGRHLRVTVIEAEEGLARHQTGHNSGVIHSGLYYKPGSLKARLCIEGRRALLDFCEAEDIPHETCGKVVVATRPGEMPALEMLTERGRANGLEGMRRLEAEEIREYEPHAAGIAGLFVPQTGIVNYTQVVEAFARRVQAGGGRILTGTRFLGVKRDGGQFAIETNQGTLHCRNLINCGGLQSDRIARLCGLDPKLQIIPFRGEYYEIVPEKAHLVRNLIYPVPDPRFPFLGVHFTRMAKGGVEAGPNAVLSFKREGYTRWSFSPRDVLEYAAYSGFWRMSMKYWKTGMGEFYRSFSKKAFTRALQRLLPDLREEDLRRGGAGVRAQALEPNGMLVDDFRIVEAERMVHVLNAPSPAATASIRIGEAIAEMAVKNFGG